MRQFLFAMACLAFLLSALGFGSISANAFAADIVLVFCGAWCANQLIRGPQIFKAQAICVLQAYFIGVLCLSILLFGAGWFLFLPVEYQNLGHSLLLAATFSTNIGLVFFPVDSGLRFDGLFHHLWLPALIAQCCAILWFVYWHLYRNQIRLLVVLGVIACVSLVLSLIETQMVKMLPIGSLWAFLFGAIPFIATHRFRVLKYASMIGAINLIAGIMAITATGDTIFARVLVALGLSFLYVGSRPREVDAHATMQRRRWFGMMLHTFLWAVPLAQLNAGLHILTLGQADVLLLIFPCLVFAIFSWTIWQHVEEKAGRDRFFISAALSMVLVINGLIGSATQGAAFRFPEVSQAYLAALDAPEPAFTCPIETDGPLAGLAVCHLGPRGAPEVLIWGDHQLDALRAGYSEAARRTDIPTLLIGQTDCIPLDGLQTRFPASAERSGRQCDRQSAQILQALPHLPSIRQVTLVGDWLFYTNARSTELSRRVPIRIGPSDGTPIDLGHQTAYIATAADHTTRTLAEQGLRVSVLRQVPSQPRFNAELAARADVPGATFYVDLPRIALGTDKQAAAARHADIDGLFKDLAVKGHLSYVNSWPAFCSDLRCDVRGGLSSDYVTSTRLTPSGALSLSDILAEDLKRVKTHTPVRRGMGS